MFDIAESRRSLLAQRTELLAERDANMKLHQRFQQIASQFKTNGNNNNNHNDGGLGGNSGGDDMNGFGGSTSENDEDGMDDMGLMSGGETNNNHNNNGNGNGADHLSQRDYYHPHSPSDDLNNRPTK